MSAGLRIVGRDLPSLLREPVACMAVVINAVLLFEFLNVVEGRLRVRPDTLIRSEEHTSELQSRGHLVCRLLLEKKKESTIEALAGDREGMCGKPEPASKPRGG